MPLVISSGHRRRPSPRDSTKSTDAGNAKSLLEAVMSNPDADELRRARTEYFVKANGKRERRVKAPLAKDVKEQPRSREQAQLQRSEVGNARTKPSKTRKSAQKPSENAKVQEADSAGYQYVYATDSRESHTNVKSDAPRESSKTKVHEHMTRPVATKSSSYKESRDRNIVSNSGIQKPFDESRYANGVSPNVQPARSRNKSTSESTVFRPGIRRSKTTSHIEYCLVSSSKRAALSKIREDALSTYVAAPHVRKSEHRSSKLDPVKSNTVSKFARKTVEVATCGICVEEVSKTKSQPLSCGHIWCHTCLRRLYIDPDKKLEPKCCDTPIPAECIVTILSTTELRAWKKKLREYREQNPLYCPKQGCNKWITRNHFFTDRRTGRKYAECTRCKTKSCPHCKKEWHKNSECPEDPDKQAVLQLADQQGWKQCHKCNQMVEKTSGCHHMSCPCGAEFCYKCGEAYVDGKRACQCSPHDIDARDYEQITWLPPTLRRWLDGPNDFPDIFAALARQNRIRLDSILQDQAFFPDLERP